MRFLVVDDEPHLRRMMRLALEGAGYDVEEAADGDQALSVFGDGRRFAATLLDQRMPGLDGLEVLSRLKQRRADACVVMVTAYATIELAIGHGRLELDDKPVKTDAGGVATVSAPFHSVFALTTKQLPPL